MEHLYLYRENMPAFVRKMSGSAALLRLRDVGMNCGLEYTSFEFFRDLPPYSRYEHSLGAALIVWHFTHDEKQTAAALLHDIATPVFAHVVDFLKGDHLRQEATESDTEKIIRNDPVIMETLAEMGLHAEDVSDYHRYPVADNDAPGLASDRLEYTLGNILNFGFGDAEEVQMLYDDLKTDSNEKGVPEIQFQSAEKALQFSELSLECSKIYVSDPDRCSMQVLADLLKKALEAGVLHENDLYRTEPEVIRKLNDDEDFRNAWKQFRALNTILKETERPDETWMRVPAKKRYIDPLVCGKGRVTELYPSYQKRLKEFREEKQDIWMKAVTV